MASDLSSKPHGAFCGCRKCIDWHRAEITRLRGMVRDLWGSRRRMAYGPKQKEIILNLDPWIEESEADDKPKRFVGDVAASDLARMQATADSLEIENKRLAAALQAIITHQEMIAGKLAPLSATVQIAKRALDI